MSSNSTLTDNSTNSDTVGLFYMFSPVVVIVPIIGFPTNIYVLWLLLRKPGICSTCDIFTANLAMLDTLCCLFQPVEVISGLFLQADEMALNSVFFNLFAGPIFQMCICVECYVGVLHPIIYLKFKPARFRLSLSIAVWVFTSILYFTSRFKDTYVFGLKLIVGSLIGELLVMFHCNCAVLRALKQQGPGSQQIHPTKLRASKIVLALLVMVMVHYVIPVVNFMMATHGHEEVGRFTFFSILAFMLVSISCCNHAIFYLVKTGKISISFC